jgi:hypothetical protein
MVFVSLPYGVSRLGRLITSAASPAIGLDRLKCGRAPSLISEVRHLRLFSATRLDRKSAFEDKTGRHLFAPEDGFPEVLRRDEPSSRPGRPWCEHGDVGATIMLNRAALILRYKQPFVDWINAVDP